MWSMPRPKKKLLDVKNRILLYLSTVPAVSDDDFDAPFSMTQLGIAKKVGISRRNVPRAVNQLIDEGMVDFKKAHVVGLKQKRKIYFLTPLGFSRVADTNLQLSKVRIAVIHTDGRKEEMGLGDALNISPELENYTDIIRETEYGVLDVGKTLFTDAFSDKKFLDYSNSLFKPRFVFGRDGERLFVKDWYADEICRALTISGIAGIGKTTLIADVVETMDGHHVFSMKIYMWSTLRNVISALSDFLSMLGQKELEQYLDSVETPKMSELHLILEKIMENTKLLVIFDDCHDMVPEVRDLLKLLFEISGNARDFKIIAIGRSVPVFYDRRAIISGAVREMALEGLDKESCRKLLEGIGASTEHLDRIYEETKGHPLFVELSHGKDIERSVNIKRFLFEAYYSHLNKKERDVLDFISVARYPVEERMLADCRGELSSLLSKGVLRENADGRFELHDLMKDFLYRSQSSKDLRRKHSDIAEYYIEFDDPKSILESLYHRIASREFVLAAELIAIHGDDIIKKGDSAALCSYIGKVLASYPEIPARERVRLLSVLAEGQITLGDWDNALVHNREIIALGEKNGHKKMVGMAHLNLGKILQRRNELDEAEKHFGQAAIIFNETNEMKLLGEIEYQFGMLHGRKAAYGKASEHFKTCLAIAESIPDKRLMAIAHNAHGKLFMSRGHFEKACENLLKAKVILEELDEYKELAKTIVGLGACSFEDKDIENTIKYQSQALEIADRCGDVRIRAYALSNLASAYIDVPDLLKAAECLDEAWKIFYRLGEKRMLASIYMNYGAVNNKRENWKEAVNNFNDAIEILEEMNDTGGLAKAKFKLGQLYGNMGEKARARKLLEEALDYYDETGENKMKRVVAGKLREL